MTCPVEIVHEMSALARGESRGRWKDGLTLEGRGGAGNEGTGSDFAGDSYKSSTLELRSLPTENRNRAWLTLQLSEDSRPDPGSMPLGARHTS